ncbi:MAG: cytochrome c [Proteobacteria bacterium]|nr:cytochrome c [Pseudomonadota bacterium]MBU1057887.1 cytochrome c [Pseudomonadota bacterium]
MSSFWLGVVCFSVLVVPPPEGNGSDGARWFAMQHCDGCHGKDGTGGRGPVLRGLGLRYWKLQAKVRNSRSPVMPSYPQERLSDQDVADILVFLEEVQ